MLASLFDESAGIADLTAAAQDWSQSRLLPLAERIDRENGLPDDEYRALWKEMGAMGFHGVTSLEEFGGLELGYYAHSRIMEEVSRASGSVALSYGAHSNLCINQITRHGTPEQHARWLPSLIDGSNFGALAMSEPGAGSDVVSMKTRATRNAAGDGWVINGSKFWITNGPDAAVIVVYAKTEREDGRDAITAFLVDTTKKGFSTGPKFDKFGMRGSNTCQLFFENVEVSDADILGPVHKGVYVLMSGLDYERLVLAAGPVGIMQACMDTVVPYTHERKQFGVPVATFQLMQGKLADMYSTLGACRSYLYATARAVDEKGQYSTINKDCAGVILYCAEKASWMATESIQALGGNGYMNEYPTGRYYRDAKLYEIGAGTSEVRRLIIGRSYNAEFAE